MMRRRDLVLGGLGLGALASAEALRPRKRLVLLRGTTVDLTIPRRFAGWEAQPVADLVGPEQAGRLARALYSETISRIYFEPATEAGVMMLVAYGDTQSDLLQLHRPEVCYPAVGYTLESMRSVELGLPGGAILPARRVVATMGFGSHAQMAGVPASAVYAIPDGLSIDDAAAVPIEFGTADDCLFEFGRLVADQTVLIQAGAGGVGLAAIQ